MSQPIEGESGHRGNRTVKAPRTGAEQVAGKRDHEPGGAKTALHRTGIDKRLLKRMELSILTFNSLDGEYLRAVYLPGENETGVDTLTVKDNRTCAAFTFFTTRFRPGEFQDFS